MPGGVDSVAKSITVNERSESNPDCNFHSSFAWFYFREIISPELIYLLLVIAGILQHSVPEAADEDRVERSEGGHQACQQVPATDRDRHLQTHLGRILYTEQ